MSFDVRGVLYDREVRSRRKDGTEVWISISVNKMVFEGAEAFIISSLDMTARKRAEEALHVSEEKARNLIRYAPAAIYEMDIVGSRFFSVNDVACQWTGLRPR